MTPEYTHEELKHWITLVSTEFYEMIYKDPWFKEIFRSVSKEFITSQQIDFMVGAFGGPQKYSGRMPGNAHPHIFIDEEVWARREAFLVEAFTQVNCPEAIRVKWLKIDHAFKNKIVMKDPSECQKRFFTDELIIVPNPIKKAA